MGSNKAARMSHESGQLAARVWWINCSCGRFASCHWDVPVSRPPYPSPKRPLGNSTWMGEWPSNSQSFIFNHSYFLVLRERSGRQSWLSPACWRLTTVTPETTLLFWETSSCQTVSRGCTQPDYTSPPTAGTRLTRQWGWTSNSGAQEGHMAGSFGVRPLGSSPEL